MQLEEDTIVSFATCMGSVTFVPNFSFHQGMLHEFKCHCEQCAVDCLLRDCGKIESVMKKIDKKQSSIVLMDP